MKALLSIKPKYVNRILSGEKKYEFRKKIFSKSIDSIIVYSSSPEKKVVCEMYFSEVLAGRPEDIWEQCSDSAGISSEDYFSYYENCDKAFAIKIDRVEQYDVPLLLDDIRLGLKAPQSFVYVGDF